MRTALVVFSCIFMLGLLTGEAHARGGDDQSRSIRIKRALSDEELVDSEFMDQFIRDLYPWAQVDTYCLVWYDFEDQDWQGWTRVDNTLQPDTFFHVDDFSGLGGGTYGGLVPLEGTKSVWCGARPGSDEYMCSWAAAPGYGNNWIQMLRSDPICFKSPLIISYKARIDTEPGYDRIILTHENCWPGCHECGEIVLHEGNIDTVVVDTLYLGVHCTKLRFRFTSDDARSDEDGLWDTDGAFILDSLTISDDNGLIYYEDFEAYPTGCKDTRYYGGHWFADVGYSHDRYSGLWENLPSFDPCGDNFSSQIVFFIGSPYPSGTYPGLYDTPFCRGSGGIEAPCQNEMVVSPIIDLTMYSTGCDEIQDAGIPPGELPGLGGEVLRFEVYEDLPYQNLVFYTWAIRNIDSYGCPGPWLSRDFYYYNESPRYSRNTEIIGDLIAEDSIQVGLGCVDMCDAWYGIYGDCAAHTPAPWFDNVRLYRYESVGPRWSFRHLDLFQDNFPGEEYIESYIRADAANDLRPRNDPVIDPGDSIVVSCTAPLGGGVDTTPDGRPKVFMHVKCSYYGDPLNPKPALFGSSLEGTYGTYYSDDGSTWTIIQGEVARTASGNPALDRYMFDLNDSLFTRGYRIDYYFEAYAMNGETSTLPGYAAEGSCFEWTCLPSGASSILFVDDFHGIGPISGLTESYWNITFADVQTPENQPDRYDVNSPSSLASNGPGSRAKIPHLTLGYNLIVWDSGDLEVGTITDGTAQSDKSNDCQMLIDWMNFNDHRLGLWICGDNVASDLAGLTSPQAGELMADWCGVQFEDDSYYDLTGGLSGGGIVNPKVKADPHSENPFWHITWGDSFYVFGGCPTINSFDVLEKTGNGGYALQYPDYGGQKYYAAVYAERVNDGGYRVRTMWFGFSFMYIRDCEIGEPLMRNQVMKDIIGWTNGGASQNDITNAEEVPAAYSLAQNFPNPFNPATTIKFGLREKGLVRLRIYNVAGQLVRTLVDEVRDAGRYGETWDGTNNNGSKVASGIYFYRLESGDFLATKKMALLR